MSALMENVFWTALRMVSVSGLAVYAVVIIAEYAKSGSQYPLELNRENPAATAGRLLVWIGVKAVAAGVGLAKAAVDFLSEPSAEVGEWLINRSPRLQQVVVRPRHQ